MIDHSQSVLHSCASAANSLSSSSSSAARPAYSSRAAGKTALDDVLTQASSRTIISRCVGLNESSRRRLDQLPNTAPATVPQAALIISDSVQWRTFVTDYFRLVLTTSSTLSTYRPHSIQYCTVSSDHVLCQVKSCQVAFNLPVSSARFTMNEKANHNTNNTKTILHFWNKPVDATLAEQSKAVHY